MLLHNVFTMTEQEIYDEFICLAIEQDREYEYVYGKYLWIKSKYNNVECLTSHVDTVDNCNPKDKTIIENRGIITAWRNGEQDILGADDRAGVYIIYTLMEKGMDFHIQLFSGEERGGTGSTAFVNNKPDLSKIKMYIALDASYTNRYVWYGQSGYYTDFLEYISSFGFKNDGHGIFTDITIITEYYDVPAVNLAVGYYKQHTFDEYLDVESMNLTMNKVMKILNESHQYKLPTFTKDLTKRHNDYESDTYQKFW